MNKRFYHYTVCDSTQKVAKQLINENKITDLFTIVLSDEQTSGVGRHERHWESGPGNLCVSFVFQNNTILNIDVLPIIAALALSKALKLKEIGLDFCYKWPNDILIESKKVAGILIERVGGYVVCGFGVNIVKAPLNVNYPATNLKQYVDQDYNNTDLSSLIIDHILEIDTMLVENIISEWNGRAFSVNKVLSIRSYNGDVVTGIFKGVANDGSAIIENEGNYSFVKFGDI